MDMTRILQQGEEAKFYIDIANFDMDERDFRVELIYGYRRHVMTIEKAQMKKSTRDRWYFVFGTEDMVGKVAARCVWSVYDEDFPNNSREEVDEQYLCFVATTPCPQMIQCPACTLEHPVTYERTTESSIAELYKYLCDNYGHKIVSSDGNYILVLKERINNNQE